MLKVPAAEAGVDVVVNVLCETNQMGDIGSKFKKSLYLQIKFGEKMVLSQISRDNSFDGILEGAAYMILKIRKRQARSIMDAANGKSV